MNCARGNRYFGNTLMEYFDSPEKSRDNESITGFNLADYEN